MSARMRWQRTPTPLRRHRARSHAGRSCGWQSSLLRAHCGSSGLHDVPAECRHLQAIVWSYSFSAMQRCEGYRSLK